MGSGRGTLEKKLKIVKAIVTYQTVTLSIQITLNKLLFHPKHSMDVCKIILKTPMHAFITSRILSYISVSPQKFSRRFGGTGCLHLQDRIIRQARNQSEAISAGEEPCLLSASPLSSETSVDFQQATRCYRP